MFWIIVIGIIILVVCFNTSSGSSSKQQAAQQAAQRAEVENLLAKDFFATVDSVAPDFKFIYIGTSSASFSNTENQSAAVIIGSDNKKYEYWYHKHNFTVSDGSRKRLAQAAAKRYNGVFSVSSKDISRDTHPSIIDTCYIVAANQGIYEQQEKKRQQNSVLKC